MTNDEFFDARIEPQENGCVLWMGDKKDDGKGLVYGRIRRARGTKAVYAHRFAYSRFVGAIPAGLSVLHRCDTPLCVNPNHLFVGTQLDNMKDMASKGRAKAPKGEAHRSCRLTDDKVRAIRASSETTTELARKYGVTYTAIHGIKSRLYWKHVL